MNLWTQNQDWMLLCNTADWWNNFVTDLLSHKENKHLIYQITSFLGNVAVAQTDHSLDHMLIIARSHNGRA